MPNQIDLFRGNYNVNGMGGGLQINPMNYVSNPPNLDIDQNGVAAFLNVLEQATGIDLNAVNPSVANALTQSSNALALANEATLAWQQTTAFLQQSWFNLQSLFDGIVGAVDSDVTATITWLQNLSTDVGLALEGNITPLLQLLFGTGVTTIPLPGTPVPATQIGNVLGGSNLGADLITWATASYGAPSVAALTVVEQDIANFLSNAISGGSAPTSAGSPVAFLDNLLGINGIPHTNVAIPPNPGSGTMTHDVGASATPVANNTSGSVA